MSHADDELERRKPKPEKLPVVWVIDSPYKGLLNSRCGIAERINPQYKIKDSHWVLNDDDKSTPDFIIGQTYKDLPQRLFGKSFLISERDIASNLCYRPIHCNRPSKLSHVIQVIGVPHAVTTEKIEVGIKEWSDEFQKYPHPRIAVLLGGNSLTHSFTKEMAQKLAQQCIAKTKELGGALLITTSKRTPYNVKNIFLEELEESAVPYYFHSWSPNGKNPYYGILGTVDTVITTGDSESMPLESQISPSKSIYIYAPKNLDLSDDGRDQSLHDLLYKLKYARPFKDFMEKGIEPAEYTQPLDTAGEIAKKALEMWRAKQVSSHGYV